MASKLQLRRGTEAEWAVADPILADGEVGFATDTKAIKVGDGVSVWSILGWTTEAALIDDTLTIGSINTWSIDRIKTEITDVNYVHPTTDGNLHVPEISTTNEGKFLIAGANGDMSWQVTPVDILVTDNIGVTVQGYDAATTIQGNTFNSADELVQLDVNGKLPVLDGSALINLPSGPFIKYVTSDVTAVSNEYLIVHDTSAITITLPATPSEGDKVYISDLANSFSAFNCTVARNGSTIVGELSDHIITKSNTKTDFVFLNGTWNVYTMDIGSKAAVAISANISGPTTANEKTVIALTATDIQTDGSYVITVTGGTLESTPAELGVQQFTWTLPDVTADTVHTFSIEYTIDGNVVVSNHDVTVIWINLAVDSLFDEVISISDFSQNSYLQGTY